MIGRTNVGGGSGGGLSPNSAVIHVTAPVGSTITFSKNNVIVKVLDASKSHVNAESTDMADWYYAVSSSNYGTWAVMAMKTGEGSASEDVTVSANRQYDIELSYNLWLIQNGTVKANFTLYNSGGNLTSGTPYAVFSSANPGATTGNAIRIAYVQADVTQYAKMVLEIADQSGTNRGRSWRSTSGTIPSIGVSVNPPTTYNNEVSGYKLFTTLSRDGTYIVPGEYEINLSDQTGLLYLAMAVSGAGSSDPYIGELHITNFYLEK